jgi:hypothetical protein
MLRIPMPTAGVVKNQPTYEVLRSVDSVYVE